MDVEVNTCQTVQDYFLELNTYWGNQNNTMVRISQIEAKLLNAAGIIDIADSVTRL